MPALRYQYAKVIPLPEVVAASEEGPAPLVTIGTTLKKVTANINTSQSDLVTVTPVLVKVRAAIQLSLIDTNPNEVWVETWEEQDP